MTGPELRQLALKFERNGHPDLARYARNRAATRELGIEIDPSAEPKPVSIYDELRRQSLVPEPSHVLGRG